MKRKNHTQIKYDFTKGGIDIPDQWMGCLTCKQKARKWTLVALAYVFDISKVNSQAIYTMIIKDISTKSLKPHMSNRITIRGLSGNLGESIKVYLYQVR